MLEVSKDKKIQQVTNTDPTPDAILTAEPEPFLSIEATKTQEPPQST